MTNENHSPARHSNTSFSLIVRLGIADCRSIQAQQKHKISFTIHHSPVRVLFLQSLDLLGQSNKFFSVLRHLERRKASSSSLGKTIRSAAASANIARLVLSSIDTFRTFSAPVCADTSKIASCGWLRQFQIALVSSFVVIIVTALDTTRCTYLSARPTCSCCLQKWVGISKMNEKCIPCPTTCARDQE